MGWWRLSHRTTDHGTTTHGTTDRGTIDHGTTARGTTARGTTDRGNKDHGTTTRGTTDHGTTTRAPQPAVPAGWLDHSSLTDTVETHSARMARRTSDRKSASGQDDSGPEAHSGIVTKTRSGGVDAAPVSFDASRCCE